MDHFIREFFATDVELLSAGQVDASMGAAQREEDGVSQIMPRRGGIDD